MKQVFNDSVIEVNKSKDGIVFSHRVGEDDGKVTVGFYKAVFSSGEFTKIQKSYYLMAKFLEHYKGIEAKVGNYVTCRACETPDGGMLIVDADGTAKIFDANGEIVNQTVITYHGEPPYSVAVSGRSFWCSYPEDNSIVRYSLKSMREELKLGGSRSAFKEPQGLFIEGGEMFVCNSGTNTLWRIGLSNYAVTEYAHFEEPVHSFMRSGKYEFVILDSGLYLLELVDL